MPVSLSQSSPEAGSPSHPPQLSINDPSFAFPAVFHSGRVSIRVLLDDELSQWRNGITRNAGAFERFRVGAGHQRRRAAPKTPDRSNEHWVVRGRGIEFLPRRPAFLGQNIGNIEIEG